MRARLVTLTGAGGSGKTRLALQVAAELLPEFPEGVWLVEFAGLSDPGLVPQSVAATLGVREQSGHPPLETLVDYLRPRELLLVLDSCEHLIAACAEMVETLLSICPDLRILATSREALGITGEMALPVPSLSAPDLQALPAFGADPVSALAGFEAIRLFLERAAAMQPDFRLTPQNARAVALICHRLDGIPLALELAAARMRALSVEQIAARLDDRFTLLTGGSRTALPRHQTLRATMDWSYDLLGEAERTLFQRQSVFVGGFLLEAAEKVTGDPSTSSGQAEWQVARNDAGRLLPAQSPRSGQGITREVPALSAGGHVSPADVLDLLTQLVNKSLVVVEDQAREARYRMLETIRQYALEKQLDSGEFVAVQTRHMEFFLSLAEEAEPELRGAEQVVWLARLEAEHDNLRAVLDWSLTRGEIERSLRLAGALYRFWYLHGYWSEGKEWIERALRSADSSALESKTLGTPSGRSRARARARALQGLGWLADASGTEGPPYKESLALCRELGDEWGAAFCLRGLGEWSLNQDDYDQAAALLGESLALFRKLKDAWGIGLALFNLGWLAFNKEDPILSPREQFDHKKLAIGLQDERPRAESLWQEGLAEFRKSGDRWGTAVTLGALAYIARLQNDLHKTVEFSDESLRLYREIGDKAGIADSLSRLGNVAYRRDDFRQAAELFEDSLALERELGYKWSAALSTSMLGLIACYQGQYGRATSLVEESLALWRERKDRWGIGWGLYVLGLAEYTQGHLDRAADLLEESLTLFRGLTDAGATAQALDALGLVTLRTGDLSRAAELLEEGLAASRQSGDKRTVTLALNHLGRLALARGDRSAAAAYYREGLMARKDMGARRGITESLEGLAALALAQGRPEHGTTLFGAAEALRELIGMPIPPVERADHQRDVNAARVALGEESFAAAWAEGRLMPLEQTIAYALKSPETRS